ncbi:hypothetical protein DFS34DRAFT_80091 [Phlyctochytrium arcticum]|nr:hypothetical protein DFS34DRAFT_80091 [Phlyctochytrium arcticum]
MNHSDTVDHPDIGSSTPSPDVTTSHPQQPSNLSCNFTTSLTVDAAEPDGDAFSKVEDSLAVQTSPIYASGSPSSTADQISAANAVLDSVVGEIPQDVTFQPIDPGNGVEPVAHQPSVERHLLPDPSNVEIVINPSNTHADTHIAIESTSADLHEELSIVVVPNSGPSTYSLAGSSQEPGKAPQKGIHDKEIGNSELPPYTLHDDAEYPGKTGKAPKATGPPTYYPRKPKGRIVTCLVYTFFPVYLIFYLIPWAAWTYILVPSYIGLVWALSQLLSAIGKLIVACFVGVYKAMLFLWQWTAVPLWKYIIVPLYRGVIWIVVNIFLGLSKALRTLYSWTIVPLFVYILIPIWRAIAWTVARIAQAIAWTVARIVQAIVMTASCFYRFLLQPLGRAIAWIFRTLVVVLVWIPSAIYRYLLRPFGLGILAVLQFVFNWILHPIYAGILWTLKAIFDYVLKPFGNLVALILHGIWTFVIRPFGQAILFLMQCIGHAFCWVGRMLKRVAEGCWWLVRTVAQGIATALKFIWTDILVRLLFQPIWRAICFLARGIWKTMGLVFDGCWWLARTIGHGIAIALQFIWKDILVRLLFRPFWLTLCFLARAVQEWVWRPLKWLIVTLGTAVFRLVAATCGAFWTGIKFVGAGLWAALAWMATSMYAYILQPLWTALAALGRMLKSTGSAIKRTIHDSIVNPTKEICKAISAELRDVWQGLKG